MGAKAAEFARLNKSRSGGPWTVVGRDLIAPNYDGAKVCTPYLPANSEFIQFCAREALWIQSGLERLEQSVSNEKLIDVAIAIWEASGTRLSWVEATYEQQSNSINRAKAALKALNIEVYTEKANATGA